MNLLVELGDSNYKDPDIYVDIYTILKNISDVSEINQSEIDKLYKEKLKSAGNFSKYLLKIN